jgi:cytochrome b involved in lipid metabolism
MKINFICVLLMMGWGRVAVGERLVSLEELRKHNTEANCWMAIDGAVYDMSQYIKLHKEACKKINFANYCGADASDVWKKKESGKSQHKKQSLRSLQKSKVGQMPAL